LVFFDMRWGGLGLIWLHGLEQEWDARKATFMTGSKSEFLMV
jgi:hypothetical protein